MINYEFEIHVTTRQTIIVADENSDDALERVGSMLDDMQYEVKNFVNADIHRRL